MMPNKIIAPIIGKGLLQFGQCILHGENCVPHPLHLLILNVIFVSQNAKSTCQKSAERVSGLVTCFVHTFFDLLIHFLDNRVEAKYLGQ